MREGYQQRTTAGDKTIHLPVPVATVYTQVGGRLGKLPQRAASYGQPYSSSR
jgi:hypothetical protein